MTTSPVLEEGALRAAMPPVAREMVDLIGFTSTMALCRAMGGFRVTVPRTIPARHQLVDVLGQPAAEALAAKYGGSRFDIPVLAGIYRLLRDNAIRSDYDDGVPARDLARRYGVTLRHVRNILKARAEVLPRAERPAARTMRAFDLYDQQQGAAA